MVTTPPWVQPRGRWWSQSSSPGKDREEHTPMPGCPWLTMNTNVNYVGYGSLMAVGYSHSVLFHNYDFQDTFFFFFLTMCLFGGDGLP